MKSFDEVFIDKTKYGTKVKTDEYHDVGKNIIVDQGQKVVAGYTDREDGIFDDLPAIIFGDHTRVVKYVDKPFFLGADGVKVLKCKLADANYKYLYYALKNAKIPDTGYNRHFKWLKEVVIRYPSAGEQVRIVEILDKVNDVIGARKKELEGLDNLIKSRFVEMFGDPEINSMNLSVKPMTEVCEIIDGDRGKNYPTQEEFFDEGYCLFLNAKNVTSSGFSFENCMFVTKEKDEILRKGHLNRGDVVLTTRGTIGNLAFYDETVPYDNVRINSGMVILRMNHKMVSERFFIEQFKMQLSSIKEKIASGSAQPQLPISTMNKIVVLMPPVEQQQVFADFVTQVDKLKFIIKDVRLCNYQKTRKYSC